MSKYTISCSKEQVEKALKLGAEEEYLTAEEMCGWLEEQEPISDIDVYKYNSFWYYEVWLNKEKPLKSRTNQGRKEATLAAIDAALDYLIDNDLIK